jgi:acyl-CoA synthetase (AMP-forming)/AMP-acid ligase II
LFHIGGIWFDMTALAAGAPLVVTDTFTAWSAIALMQRHRVSKVCLVPAMIQMVLAEPECADADWSALDCIVYGGSPIPVPVLKRALEVFGCRFAQIYGLTETGNTAVCLRPEDHADPEHERLAAAGRPYPGVQCKIIDESGEALGPREVGEICLRSPANMVGYWKNRSATAATLVDGWVHTGDAGFLDQDGYVFVNDRIKDMIIYAGENIYPAEVESALCGHPDVAEAAVIGVPDERWGERVLAVVVRRPGSTATARQILRHAATQIAAFKVPKSVDFIDALPRTPSGKIQKHVLRKPYWEGRDRQVN